MFNSIDSFSPNWQECFELINPNINNSFEEGKFNGITISFFETNNKDNNNMNNNKEDQKDWPFDNISKYISYDNDQSNNINYFQNIIQVPPPDQINNSNNLTSFKQEQQNSNQINNVNNLEIYETKNPTKKKKKKNKENKENKELKKLGKKRLFSNEKGKHGRDSEDNLIRKSKNCFHDDFILFINEKIKAINKKVKINKKNKVKKLLNLGSSINNNLTIDFNLELFKNPIVHIFEKISKKYKKCSPNHNLDMIDKIYKNDAYKEIQTILDLNYLDCLKHYRKDENTNLDCLNGLEKKFENIHTKMKTQFYNVRKRHYKKYKDYAPKDLVYDEEHVDNIIKKMKDLDKIYEEKSKNNI